MKYIYFFSLFFILGNVTLCSQELSNLYDNAVDKQKKGAYKEAIEIYSTILQKSPYYVEAYLGRAQSQEAIKKYDLAIEDYTTAIQKNPAYSQAYYYRAYLYFTIKKDNKKTLADLQKALELKSTYYEACLLRGDVYMSLNKYEESIKDYSMSIELKADVWESYYKRARVYVAMDKYKEALSDLTKVILLYPDFADAYMERGRLYREASEYVLALADYQKANKLGVGTEELYQCKADIHYELKQYKLALEDYSILINTYKKRQAEWYSKRGVCYTTLGDSINAQKDFTKAISLDKNNYLIYVYRAENHIKRDHISYALNDYNKALELSPKSWEIYLSRGKAYLEQGKYNEAAVDFSLAIKYNARLGEAYFYRGACKDALKDVEGACSDLEKAASLHHQEAEKRLKKYCK